LQGLLIRVGIDSGNVGYVGPIYWKTREFVYLPLPAKKESITSRTYGSEKVTQTHGCRFFKDKFLADFMHIDRAKVCVGYDWKRQQELFEKAPAHSLKIHLDPEFDGLTYGDYWRAVGRIPKSFDSEDWQNERHVFFYAGLAPYPKCFRNRIRYTIKRTQEYQMNVYLIAHFKVKTMYSIEKHGNLDNFSKEIGTNAHFIEKEHIEGLKGGHSSKLVVIKGQKKESRGLLPKAIQLSVWSDRKRMYVPYGVGNELGIKEAWAIRQTNTLNSVKTSLLLDKIDSLR
jgi:hypothetical protein